MRLQTLAVHTGVDKDSSYNSVITPIYQTSTFRFEDIGKTKGYDYTRTSNPTGKRSKKILQRSKAGSRQKPLLPVWRQQ